MKQKLRDLLRTARTYALDIIVVGVSILALVLVFAPPAGEIRDVAFDPVPWQAETSSCVANMAHFSNNVRAGMAKDLARHLLETHPRPGKQEVARLLGEPDASKTPRLWSYRSGASTMDCLTFDVVFDQGDRVAGAHQTQH